jgi:hypothetical protein
MTATQPRAPGRVVTLNPFELGASVRESLGPASPPDVGCVDWYLYPAERKARSTGLSRGGPRDGAAAATRENPAR